MGAEGVGIRVMEGSTISIRAVDRDHRALVFFSPAGPSPLTFYSSIHHDEALESRMKMRNFFRMRLPKTKSPSGDHDKEGQATVASFRTWRGLPAFNPWPLTGDGTCHARACDAK